MGTVIMETAHTGKCATPLASVKSVYAYAGPTGVFRCRAPYERTDRADPGDGAPLHTRRALRRRA